MNWAKFYTTVFLTALWISSLWIMLLIQPSTKSGLFCFMFPAIFGTLGFGALTIHSIISNWDNK